MAINFLNNATAITAAAGDNSTKIATTAYVDAAAAAVPVGDYLPLTGGTLTGGLTGTSATFTGNVTAGSLLTIKGASPYIQWQNVAGTRLGYIQHNTNDLIYNADVGIHKFNQNATFTGLIIGQDSGSVQLNLKRGASGTDGNTSILFTQPLGNGYIGVDANGAFSYGIAADLSLSKFKVSRIGDATFVGTTTVQGTGDSSFVGSVGIGTTSPDAKLEVSSTALVSGDARYELLITEDNTASAGRGGGLAFSRQGTIFGGIKTLQNTSSNDNATMYFQTRGGGTIANRMVIDELGNVGIGTTSPAEKLYVNSISGDARIGLNAPTGSDTEIKFSNNGVVQYSIGHDDATDNFVIGTANVDTPKVSIDKTGNVGIGTTSPSARFSVLEPTANTEYASMGSGSTVSRHLKFSGFVANGTNNVGHRLSALNAIALNVAGDDALYIDNSGNVGIGTDTPDATLEIQTGTNAGKVRLSSDGNGAVFSGNGDLQFYTNNVAYSTKFYSANKGSALLTILDSGNVGIGTTSPDRELEVEGDGNVYIRVTAKTDNDATAIELKNTQETWTIKNQDTNDDALQFESDTVTAMTILKTGNVGIGATNPTATLDVNGQRGTATNLATTKTAAGFDLNSNTTGGSNSLTIGETNQTSYFLQHANSAGTTAYDIVLNPYGGNVGIGTDNPDAKLEVAGDVLISSGEYLSWGTAGATSIEGSTASNKLQFRTSSTDRMIINDTGVGIGTDSPDAKLDVRSSATTAETIAQFGNGNIQGGLKIKTNGNLEWGLETLNARSLTFGTNNTETMRITSGGDVLVGKDSSNLGTNGVELKKGSTSYITNTSSSPLAINRKGNDGQLIGFYNDGAAAGAINCSGTTVSYATSSDYRLKEDLQDFAGLDMVSKIPVYDYKWKSDESRSYGVMAHELQEVLPDAVVGEKDAEEMQGVDYSKIVPLLIKSIQELTAKVERLEANK